MASLPQVLVRNWRLKLSALGLSVLLWALVQTEPTNRETLSSVPVFVQVTDSSWTTSGPPTPASVELRIGGPPREIFRLAREAASIRVPIAAVGSLDTIISLRRDWIDLGRGSGLTVQSVSPSAVRVSFEPARTRLLPLSSRFVGQVPDDLALAADIDFTPRLVRVRGPESRIADLDSVRLEPFDLSEVSRSGAYTVAVDTAGLLGATLVPRSATVNVRVEDMVERLLDDIPIEAVADPGEAEVVVEPASMQIRLAGARSLVTALDPTRLRVRVPPEFLRGMQPGEERYLRVQVDGVPPLIAAVPEIERVAVRLAAEEGESRGAREVP